jgi:hypothetical protein
MTTTHQPATPSKYYKLDWSLDHLPRDVEPEDRYDAQQRKFPKNDVGLYEGKVGRSVFAATEPLPFPARIEFIAFGEIWTYTDYPYTDVRWPIMSKRMLDTLLRVSYVPHRTYPVVMVDGQIFYDEKLGKRVPIGTENHDYVAVQLTDHEPVFDYDRSVYDEDPEAPHIITHVKKLVLTTPPGGFPSLFRVRGTGLRLPLYVSAEARAALEAAGIRGVEFSLPLDYTTNNPAYASA